MLSFCSQPEPCEQPTVTLFIVFWMKNASSSESVTSGEIIEIESSTAEFSLFCGVHVLRISIGLAVSVFFFWDPMHTPGIPTHRQACLTNLCMKSES